MRTGNCNNAFILSISQALCSISWLKQDTQTTMAGQPLEEHSSAWNAQTGSPPKWERRMMD